MSHRERLWASEGTGGGNGVQLAGYSTLIVDDRRQPSSSRTSTRSCHKVGFAQNGGTQIGMQIEASSCNLVEAFGQNHVRNTGLCSILDDLKESRVNLKLGFAN